MNQKRLLWSALLLTALGLTNVQAQSMKISARSGSLTTISLSNISRMTFSSGSVSVKRVVGNTDSFVLTDLRHLSFGDVTTGISGAVSSSDEAMLYPNPVREVATIRIPFTGISGVVEIVALDAKVVAGTLYDANTTTCRINLSTLTKGMYICRISNGTESKTTKFIKQ
jgi:hypothetical protein